MHYTGRWLTGTKGTRRVVDLVGELNKKTKQMAETDIGKVYSHYEPWMCYPACYDFWSGSRPPALGGNNDFPGIITDPAALSFLHEAFSDAETRPFGRLDYHGSGMRVAKGDVAELNRFKVEMNQARQMLCAADKSFCQRLETLVYHIIPLGPVHDDNLMRKDGSGLSLHHYRGGILLGLPATGPFSVPELAINLAHELGHQAAMVYQYADRILKSDFDTPVYSAVRKTVRPGLMSFHALVALAYMYEFLKFLPFQAVGKEWGDYFGRRLMEIHSDFEVGLQTISHISFTELGAGMMGEFRDLLESA